MNFTLRLSAVICVLPVRGILRILPCLCRTSNLPKEGRFKMKPSVFFPLDLVTRDATGNRENKSPLEIRPSAFAPCSVIVRAKRLQGPAR